MDDKSLLKLYHSGDKAACSALLVRYAALINRKASGYEAAGVERDDWRQEAYMGLLAAVRTFDETKGASFYTYAGHCINNRLNNHLAAATTKKAAFFSSAISFDEMAEIQTIARDTRSPEAIFIEREDHAAFLKRIADGLSSFEKDVLFLYLSGCDYTAVAQKLSSSLKSVDNALQRARKKLKKVLNNL